MNKHDKEIQDCLEAMPFTEARRVVRSGTLYTIGSPNHDVALSWLEGKEAELRDDRETETLSMAKEANSVAKEANSIARSMFRAVWKDRIIAIAAAIIALIAAREDIILFISWIISKIKSI